LARALLIAELHVARQRAHERERTVELVDILSGGLFGRAKAAAK
jgi:hypothetical protein